MIVLRSYHKINGICHEKYGPLPKTVPGTRNNSKTSLCGQVSDLMNGPRVPNPKP